LQRIGRAVEQRERGALGLGPAARLAGALTPVGRHEEGAAGATPLTSGRGGRRWPTSRARRLGGGPAAIHGRALAAARSVSSRLRSASSARRLAAAAISSWRASDARRTAFSRSASFNRSRVGRSSPLIAPPPGRRKPGLPPGKGPLTLRVWQTARAVAISARAYPRSPSTTQRGSFP
jgi:hypothetical protein